MAPNSRSARRRGCFLVLKVDCVDGSLILSDTFHMHPQQSLNLFEATRPVARPFHLIQKICGDFFEASVRQSDRK